MKRILGIVFIIATNLCHSQDDADIANIKKQFNYASLLLEHNAPFDALREFIKINHENPNHKLVKLSKAKVDSLLEVTRAIIKQEVKGKWQKTSNFDENGEYRTSDGLNSYLEITDSHFIFYRIATNTKDIIIERKEPIMFGRFDQDFESLKYDFLFSDNSLWSISVSPDSENLSIIHTGNQNPNSRSIISCGGEGNSYKRVN